MSRWIHYTIEAITTVTVIPVLEGTPSPINDPPKRVVLQCIFPRDLLSLPTVKVSGIENYPSVSMSCCSDDLAQLPSCLDL